MNLQDLISDYISKCSEKRMELIEILVAALHIASKGKEIDPSLIELVEQRHSDGKTSWFFRKRDWIHDYDE